MRELTTRWSEEIRKHPDEVLSEYPRPALVRDSYVNLNGFWDYAITQTKEKPASFQGKILVPFSPEAPLSGVDRQLKPNEYLWYRRTLPEEVKQGRWILHFGAVDQFAAVYVNGRLICRHLGGYLPFSAEVTDAIKAGKNELVVVVRDFSDCSYFARGKQKLKRGGMFYTAQSGIWQTVWMEQVPQQYIQSLRIVPDFDKEQVEILVESEEETEVAITVSSVEMEQVQVSGKTGQKVQIPIKNMHSWSPEDPFLYDVAVSLGEDQVSSYFAMRKISKGKDEKGIPRIFLNNKPYFQRGVLDQGYWPDGLYTAPSDEALLFDIQEMKRLGFNMLRKHIKIEPQRWYYHCDRLGMLVWQDMVCGGGTYHHWYVTYMATAMGRLKIKPGDKNYRLLGRREEQGKEQFIQEMKETISLLSHHPSVVTWVIFNEGWGQFDAKDVTKIAYETDDTRLIDQASGWFDQHGGDFRSIHEYFFDLKIKPEERITALTEYGGYSWHIDEHSMCEKVYGYHNFTDEESLSAQYEKLHETQVIPNIPRGLSATVYTQLSDIEEEVNGIYTYDREVLKIDEEVLKKCNQEMEF